VKQTTQIITINDLRNSTCVLSHIFHRTEKPATEYRINAAVLVLSLEQYPTRLPSDLRPTTRECVHLVTRDH